MIQFNKANSPALSEVLNDTYFTQNDWFTFEIAIKHDASLNTLIFVSHLIIIYSIREGEFFKLERGNGNGMTQHIA